MKVNKLIALLIILAATLAFTACNANTNANSQPNPGTTGTPNTAAAGNEGDASSEDEKPSNGESSGPKEENGNGKKIFSDEYVTVEVSFGQESYTTDELIDMKVTIKNDSDKIIIFEKGSGSNRVPQALQVNFGGFANTFTPLITTADFNVETLEPGQSVSFDLPHAPFTPVGEQMHGVSFGENIDFFRTEDYTPAQPGEVRGELTFRYLLKEEGTEPIMHDFSGNNLRTIHGEFSVMITEDNVSS